MRNIFYCFAPALLLFASCTKDYPPQIIDESQWLNRERAVVVYSDFQCPYYIVEAQYGYSVLRSWDGNIPVRGSVMYGDFSSWGHKIFYNRSEGYLAQAEITYYWLSYWDAIDEVNYQCGR